ncbi:SUKH-4 family immunity protein [Streptomyces sp. NPDC005931]|uniref:SUKH-4 family immunity protein n=1 Tax=Streptomyces sp. NPDC005931 TaxID=3364737 RepID=UPI0036BA04A1
MNTTDTVAAAAVAPTGHGLDPYVTYAFPGRPDLMDRRPLAPTLPTLLRFASATEELAGLRAQFAAHAGRCGTGTAARASRRLPAALEETTADGEPVASRRLLALIRPLAPVTGRGTASGLSLDLPLRFLDQEFGRRAVVRFDEIDFPAALTHEPTRRFLCETGLPEDAFLFHLDTDAPLRTLAEDRPDAFRADLPAHADRLLLLGRVTGDTDVVVDGTTGAILTWSEGDRVLHPLNTDVSTLAATLCLLHGEHTLDGTPGHPALTSEAHDRLAMTMIGALTATDPEPPVTDADWHSLTRLLENESGGVR